MTHTDVVTETRCFHCGEVCEEIHWRDENPSGDHETEKHPMMHIFNHSTNVLFNQSSHDKLDYIQNLQYSGSNVMMIGDGLNDAGALKQADVGIAVTDDTGVFNPACDGILHGSQITKLCCPPKI